MLCSGTGARLGCKIRCSNSRQEHYMQVKPSEKHTHYCLEETGRLGKKCIRSVCLALASQQLNNFCLSSPPLAWKDSWLIWSFFITPLNYPTALMLFPIRTALRRNWPTDIGLFIAYFPSLAYQAFYGHFGELRTALPMNQWKPLCVFAVVIVWDIYKIYTT